MKRTIVLDVIERVVIVGFYGVLVARMVPSVLAGHAYNAVVLAAEAVVLVLVLVRRFPTSINVRPGHWCIAFIGTAAPMAVLPAAEPWIPPFIGTTIAVAGILMGISAKLVLRRAFGLVAANRGIVLGGPYRVVRHPIYAAYFITNAAVLLLNPLPWNLAVYLVWSVMQLTRIVAEEEALRADPVYRDYMSRVRSRLVPGLF